jgi:hypothetical protein
VSEEPKRKKRVVRERSYEPPFSGAKSQPVTQYRKIHKRWILKLKNDPPEGVPPVNPLTRCKRCGYAVRIHDRQEQDGKCGPITETTIDDPWPATFGDMGEDGVPHHRSDEGQGYCFQCGNCCYFVTLDASLGADWGACTNPASQYDGRVTFEHWSCRAFSFDGLRDQEAAADGR